MSYQGQVEQLGRWIRENFPDEKTAPPVESSMDIMFRQKLEIEELNHMLKIISKSESNLAEQVNKLMRNIRSDN